MSWYVSVHMSSLDGPTPWHALLTAYCQEARLARGEFPGEQLFISASAFLSG